MVKFQNDMKELRKVRAVSCRISSLGDLESVATFFEQMRGWVFRGQCKAKWKLKTSLERDCPNVTLFRERMAIRDFKELAKGLVKHVGSRIDWLACMQHYGTPTRLLDFTKSFDVALYFSFSNPNSGEDHAMWAINLHEFMDRSRTLDHQLSNDVYSLIRKIDYRDDPVVLEQGMADAMHENLQECEDCLRKAANAILNGKFGDEKGILPVELNQPFNKRLIAQKGLFLMPISLGGFMENLKADWDCDDWHLRHIRTVEELQDEISGNGDLVMVKLVIKNCVKKDVLHYLKKHKMTATAVYPDLSGAAQAVHY